MVAIGVAIGCVLGAGSALAGGDGRFCSATANDQFKACGKEVKDDFFVAHAKCVNVSDPGEREACLAEARAQRREGRQLCGEQRVARKALCAALGEDRYDPDFDPANFDSDFRNLTNPNPYRPLGIGSHWEFAGGDETIVIDVLDKTKLIDGVTCLVVQDRVSKNGELVEDTDDWFAQAKNGDVFYCGEEVKDFESFDGDDPRSPELVSIDGSFKQGRDGDKGGIYFQGVSTVGRGIPPGVLARERRGRRRGAVHDLRFRQRPATRPVRTSGPRGAPVCRQGLRGDGRVLADPSRARWLRAQVLRARDRCLPRDRSGHGGHRSTGRLQRRSEVCRLACAVSLTRADERATKG